MRINARKSVRQPVRFLGASNADSAPILLIAENGGTVRSGEQFTVQFDAGVFDAFPPESVMINGVPCTDIAVVSSTAFTATAGSIPAGSGYSMEILF